MITMSEDQEERERMGEAGYKKGKCFLPDRADEGCLPGNLQGTFRQAKA